jgi:hypothetical protein
MGRLLRGAASCWGSGSRKPEQAVRPSKPKISRRRARITAPPWPRRAPQRGLSGVRDSSWRAYGTAEGPCLTFCVLDDATVLTDRPRRPMPRRMAPGLTKPGPDPVFAAQPTTPPPRSSAPGRWPRSRAGATTAGPGACSPRARELNSHIPRLPGGPQGSGPSSASPPFFGEETEAVDYAVGPGRLWASVPATLAWLEHLTRPAPPHAPALRQPWSTSLLVTWGQLREHTSKRVRPKRPFARSLRPPWATAADWPGDELARVPTPRP